MYVAKLTFDDIEVSGFSAQTTSLHKEVLWAREEENQNSQGNEKLLNEA